MRTFITIVFFLGLGFLTSCGESKKQSSVVISSSFALTANDMEMVIVGKNLSTNSGFTKIFTGELSLILDNGSWEFAVIGWEKSANGPYYGNNKCGHATKVLDGGESTVTLSINQANCTAVSAAGYTNAGLFQTVAIAACTDLVGLANYSSICGSAGVAQSFTVSVLPFEYSPMGSPDFRPAQMLHSFCAASNNLRLPVRTGFIFPINIRAHSSADCSPGVNDQLYLFPRGLDDTVKSQVYTSGSTAKLFLSNPALGTAPVALNLTPASTNEDDLIMVTLNYTDVDGDEADYCQIMSPAMVTESIPCDCAGGICTVGMQPTANHNGAASFSYKVRAAGQLSNIATVTLNINAINDPPFLSIAPMLGTTMNTPITANITISDWDEGYTCGAIVVSNSTNPTLIPVSNVVSMTNLGNGVCSFDFIPMTSQTGSSMIQFSYNDGVNTPAITVVDFTVSL